MNSLQLNTYHKDKVKGISLNIDNLILLNFTVLVFFTFFGTKLPFQEISPEDTFKSETTNIVNQILYIFLFLSSIVVVIARFITILRFIKKEKYLSLFILLCLVSAVWSDYHIISFKRSFQLLSVYIVVITALLFTEPSKLLKVLKIIISLYLLVNIFSALFINEAIDPQFGTWRGITDQKNLLARFGLYCFLISIFFYGEQSKRVTKITNYAVSLLSVIIIIMAGSTTVLVMLFLIICMSLVFWFEGFFKSLQTGRTFMIISLLFLISVTATLYFLDPGAQSKLFGVMGKRSDLTGRTEFWEYLQMEVKKRITLGYGYGTYWIMGSAVIANFAAFTGGFMVNQAHNGYLEIALELGLVGLALFVIILIVLIYRVFKLKSNSPLLFIVALVLLDWTEATLFTQKGISTVVFMSLYIETSIFYFNLKESQRS